MQSLIENLGGPSVASRKKLGGLLKQALATVESRLEEAAQDMSKMMSSTTIAPSEASHDLPMILPACDSPPCRTVAIETDDMILDDHGPREGVRRADAIVLELESKAREREQILLATIAELQREGEQQGRHLTALEDLMAQQRDNWHQQRDELLSISDGLRAERDRLLCSIDALEVQLHGAKDAAKRAKEEKRQLEESLRRLRVECEERSLQRTQPSEGSPRALNTLESTYWEEQRDRLLVRICSLERDNERLRELTMPSLEGVDEAALETIVEQQEQIELLKSDLEELRSLYQQQLQDINAMLASEPPIHSQ